MKIKRYLILVLAISMLLTAVCMFTATAEEETATPEIDLKIYAKNLALENSIYVSYAVPVEGTEGADSVKMLFWLTPQSEYTYGTQTYELSPEAATSTIGGKQYYVFEFDKLAAKQMTVDIYARVYATDGENEYYSKLDKYSILQYAYNKLGKTSSSVPTATLKNLLNDMLTYGARAQEHFGTNLDRLATASYYQIKINGATLSDGADHGLYLSGTQLSVIAPEKNADGEDFLYWQNSAGDPVNRELTYTIQVGKANDVYNPIYGEKVPEETNASYFTFTKLSDDTYSIAAKDINNMPAELVIPAVYNDVAVTKIANSAFSGCKSLTSVIIPDSVTNISYEAFKNCSGLTSIIISDSVTTFGTSSFYGCTGMENVYYTGTVEDWCQISFLPNSNPMRYGKELYFNNVLITELEIPATITKINNNTFYGCSGFTSVTIPNSVTSIGASAFYGCSGLTSVIIPNSVTTIGGSAFSGCSGLTSIDIPNSVTKIDSSILVGCDNLKTITSSSSAYPAINNCLIEASTQTLIAGCKNSIIPTDGSVKYIDSYVFHGNDNLISINIPDGVTSIGAKAFSDCTGLTSITISDGVIKIGNSAFEGCTSLANVYYAGTAEEWSNNISIGYSNEPLTSADIYYYSESQPTTEGNYWRYVDGVPTGWEAPTPSQPTDNSYLVFTELSDGTYGIKAKDINNMPSEVVIPSIYNGKAVTEIQMYAFMSCKTVTSIIIPESVIRIQERAFSGCTNLTSITIPDSVTRIYAHAFDNCSNLADITIGEGLKSIYEAAFLYCYNLHTVYYNGTVESWCDIGFADFISTPMCYGADLYFNNVLVTTLEIPNTITQLNRCAFFGCTSLTNVTISGSMSVISDLAFQECVNLTSVTFPNCLTSIGYCAFFGCTSLTDITIPYTVTSIGECAFYGCTSLVSISVPNTITNIGISVFDNCESLTSLVIPDSVTCIDDYAFYYCTSLKTVYYTGTAEQWAGISIGSDNSYLTNATRYYYSKAQPTTEGNYWHYVDGIPTKW